MLFQSRELRKGTKPISGPSTLVKKKCFWDILIDSWESILCKVAFELVSLFRDSLFVQVVEWPNEEYGKFYSGVNDLTRLRKRFQKQ